MSNYNSHPTLLVDAKFNVGAEAANTINVAVQLVDRENGNRIAAPVGLNWYLSASPVGAGATTATTGGIAIGTHGSLLAWTANVSGLALTNASGVLDANIIDTGAKTIYLVLVAPDGKLLVSPAITFVTE